jgi:hypothetical protein
LRDLNLNFLKKTVKINKKSCKRVEIGKRGKRRRDTHQKEEEGREFDESRTETSRSTNFSFLPSDIAKISQIVI